MSEKEIDFVLGSGNVFRDLGDPQADLKQGTAVIAARMIEVLDGRGLAVHKAGSLTGFAAADSSRIRNADLGRFRVGSPDEDVGRCWRRRQGHRQGRPVLAGPGSRLEFRLTHPQTLLREPRRPRRRRSRQLGRGGSA